ncbi:MAG TPA: GntR family transcriptional regulator [Streptosporangiaceae bacterium]|nr:GntR family transcriptional regulator [Streptosporangiaceae bacterium]
MADPLYRKIADDLRRRIEFGELEPGSQLPTELELRDQYDNASRNTVRDAIRWLTTRGLVVTQPGRGTFVVEKITPFIVPLSPSGAGAESGVAFQAVMGKQGGDPSLGPPRVEVQNAREEIARELQIKLGESVVSRHQQRFIDGRPSSLQTSFYPMQFVIDGASDLLQAVDIPMGGTKYVENKLGIQQAGYRDRLTVRVPNAGEVAFFKVPDDGSVLMVVVHRTAYDESVKPIRFTASVYPADRNHFVIDFGKVPPPEELIAVIRGADAG